MLEDGLIEDSTSEWSDPMFIVIKKNGSCRTCVDYRKLNAVATFDAYPMQRIDEMLDQIGQSRFLIKLDLAKGYWQVPV